MTPTDGSTDRWLELLRSAVPDPRAALDAVVKLLNIPSKNEADRITQTQNNRLEMSHGCGLYDGADVQVPLFGRSAVLAMLVLITGERLVHAPVQKGPPEQSPLNRAAGTDSADAVSLKTSASTNNSSWEYLLNHLSGPSDLPPIPAPAVGGTAIVTAIWWHYLAYCRGSTASSSVLHDVIRSLRPTALVAGPDDNPEPWWASEMMILHALQSFAFLSGDASLHPFLTCAVAFHLAEIQPDHATNEPWAIHAYANHPDGQVTAETLLHAGMIQHAGRLGPVAQLLAADAAFTLSRNKV